jgi:hypothetical protein
MRATGLPGFIVQKTAGFLEIYNNGWWRKRPWKVSF